MTKYCIKCAQKIPEQRLDVLGNDCNTCVNCSDTSYYGAVQIITDKTNHVWVPVNREIALDIRKKQERRGIVSNGMKFK